MTVTHRSRPHLLLALIAALACALTVLAPAPAQARPAGAKWPWVVGQSVQANGKVSVRLQWKKIARSRKYKIDYAPLKGKLGSGEVQKSRKKKSLVVKGKGGAYKNATVKNLKAGKVYCFQVYGVSGKSYGNRGGVHCKMTTRANRRAPRSGFPLVMGTFNTCSASCTDLAPWRERAPQVRDRILQMRADVVAVQEGNEATPYLEQNLPGFVKGCQTSDGVKGRPLGDRDQSLFVRTSTYDVVPRTAGGLDFKALTGNYAHGACWVLVRHKATQAQVVVVSSHFSGTPAVRVRQMKAVVDRINGSPALVGVPRAFAGDFNSNASHTSRKADVSLSAMRAAGGYDNAYDMANRFLTKPFYNSGGAGQAKAKTSWTWGDHVDRVFVSPGVHVASWKVDYRIRKGRNVNRVSDHNPVIASLVVPR